MDVRFVMFKANGTRHEFPLRKERTIVGRTNNCDLRIPLSSVSRQHCEVTTTDGKVKLRDLGSSNGTYHNSTRVTAATLKAGDEIVIGPAVFTGVIDGRPAKLEAKRTVLNTDAASAGVNLAPSDAVTPGPSIATTRQQTIEAMQSAASALAQAVEEDEPILELPDAPAKSRAASPTAALPPAPPTAPEPEPAPAASDEPQPDEDGILIDDHEPGLPDKPAAPAQPAEEEEVLALADDDEPSTSADPGATHAIDPEATHAALDQPEALSMDDEPPLNVESDAFSPTTELDDPIAALGRMVSNKKGEDEILLLPDDEDESENDPKAK